MRKVLWVLLFAAAGYAGFRYATRRPVSESSQALASTFARALIRNDTAALEHCVAGEARNALPRIRSELSSFPGWPPMAFQIRSIGGMSNTGSVLRIVDLFGGQGRPLASVTLRMTLSRQGWIIDRVTVEAS